MILEDTTGRLKILKNDVIQPNKFVTGTVVALCGTINKNGIFEAEDFTFASYPKSTPLPDFI